MHIAPKSLAQLKGRNNLAGAGYKETERRQLLGRQMYDRLTAQEGAVGPEPEACKSQLSIPVASIGGRKPPIFRSGRSGRKRFLPIQRSSLEVPVNLLAYVLPSVQDEWQLPAVASGNCVADA